MESTNSMKIWPPNFLTQLWMESLYLYPATSQEEKQTLMKLYLSLITCVFKELMSNMMSFDARIDSSPSEICQKLSKRTNNYTPLNNRIVKN